jgi:hypothetical protein
VLSGGAVKGQLSRRLKTIVLEATPGPLFGCHESIKNIYLPTDSRRQLNLAKQNETINEEIANLHSGGKEGSEIKKEFVEPAISVPVDVLEATTFFQATTSGKTN